MAETELAARLGAHIAALTQEGPRHPENPAGIAATLDFLTATLSGFGYQVQHHRYGEEDHQINLTAELGADHRGGILDLGAHWDSVSGSPGADDNASGVAGLVEIARELAAEPSNRALRLCFFAEEEVGGLPGSTAHVEASLRRGEQIEAAIVLEMIGYRDSRPGSQRLPEKTAGLLQSVGVRVPEVADFIAVVGDSAASDLVASLVEAAGQQEPQLPAFPLVLPAGALGGAARSDHATYWKAGIPGVMVTDTANFRNPHYHQPSDTAKTISLEFAAEVVEMVLGALRSRR